MVFQLLSIFGLFADINMITWVLGVSVGGLLVNLSYQLLQLVAIQTLYTNGAEALILTLTNEWIMFTAAQALSASILASNKESWLYAQKMGMGEEKAADAEAAQETLLATLFSF